MHALPVTSLYAALLALVLLALSARVIAIRRAQRISVGAGGDKTLEIRMRSHANFCEYVPFILLLLAMLELGGLPAQGLHGLGGALVVARVAHPFGMEGAGLIFRMVGMLLTFAVLIIATLALLAQALPGA